jgi:hypothetical protein
MSDIEFIAQRLYDLLSDREWEFDAWNERNSCLSCGAHAKAGMYTPLPKHKDGCEFVEVTKHFERWRNENGNESTKSGS